MTENKELGEKIKIDEGEIDLTEGADEVKGLTQYFTFKSCLHLHKVSHDKLGSTLLHYMRVVDVRIDEHSI